MNDYMNNGNEAEQAIRSYLLWLDDPSSLRDQQAIDEATAMIEHDADPIARLKAIARLEALEAVDGSAFRDGFVANAKAWAAENGVSGEAFRRLGVSPKDLRDAGLSGGARSSGGAKSSRRTRVNPDVVRGCIPDGQFRVAEIEERSGASTATVRKVIVAMIDEGLVVDLGPDQHHAGRGRAPLIHRRAANPVV